VGTGGFKGRPDAAGDVETGYSIVQSFQRRGYATEAVGGLVGWALGHADVRRVIAHTFPHLAGSIGVLTKLGFERVDEQPSEEGTVRYALRRPASS
jgi:RimJ/RimL family protein N-acetyltransferase